jgi:hypothetical protein
MDDASSSDENVIEGSIIEPAAPAEAGADLVAAPRHEVEATSDIGQGLIPLYEDYKLVERVSADELDARINQAEADVKAAVADARSITARPEEQLDEQTGQALVLAGQSADVVKRNMGQLQSRARRAQLDIAKRKGELDRLLKARSAEMERVLKETLGPLEEMVKQMQEGIWTVNLYLGRDEQLVRVRDGVPAPSDAPITVRQLVLAMDQESAANAEGGGLDSRDIENSSFTAFDEWLLADQSHVDQIIPEIKGIVALRPRFDEKDHGDAHINANAAAANHTTYFLIRNGEQLWRVCTDFRLGERLVPTADEFTSYFERLSWTRTKGGKQQRIQPGTKEWIDAEKAADARKRHFMRVGLILQGLIDRTAALHPLPDAGLSFLHMDAYTDGRIQVVLDAENTLASGRESFAQWQRRLSGQLRVGMRIIGAFDGQGWREANDARDRDGRPDWRRHSRLSPQTARERPVTGEIYTLEARKGASYVFRFARTELVFRGSSYGGDYAVPQKRISCAIDSGDSFILPHDLATVEEMRYFLGSRANRHSYVEMFPVLKAAIAAKEAELAEEAPFRLMLVGAMSAASFDIAGAEAAVDELISWYKLGNRHHRALVAGDSKAVKVIVAEYQARLRAGSADSDVAARLLAEHPEALLIGRRKDGRYMMYVPANDENVYVHQLAFTAKGAPASEWDGAKRREWVAPQPHVFNRWQAVHEAERWAKWNLGADLAEHLTGPETERAVAELREREAQSGHEVLAITAYRPSSYETYDRRPRLRVYRRPDPQQIDAEQPLSGQYTPGKLQYFNALFSRERGRLIVNAVQNYGHDASHSGTGRAWDGRSNGYGMHEQLVYEDSKAVDAWDAQREAEREQTAQRDKLVNRARKLEMQIEQAWRDRVVQAEREKFVSDGLDLDLWDDHAKGIRTRYPHNSGPADKAIERMCELLAERSVETDGRLVGEVVSEELGARDGHFDATRRTRAFSSDPWEIVPASFTLPADVLDLCFGPPAEQV